MGGVGNASLSRIGFLIYSDGRKFIIKLLSIFFLAASIVLRWTVSSWKELGKFPLRAFGVYGFGLMKFWEGVWGESGRGINNCWFLTLLGERYVLCTLIW